MEEECPPDAARPEPPVRTSRRRIETGHPAAAVVNSAFAKQLIRTVPDSHESSTHTMFRQDVKVEIEGGSLGLRKNIRAPHLVFLICSTTPPQVPNQITLAIRGKTRCALGKPRGLDVVARWHSQEIWMTWPDLSKGEVLRQANRQQGSFIDRLNHQLVDVKPDLRRKAAQRAIGDVQQPRTEPKFLDGSNQFLPHRNVAQQ